MATSLPDEAHGAHDEQGAHGARRSGRGLFRAILSRDAAMFGARGSLACFAGVGARRLSAVGAFVLAWGLFSAGPLAERTSFAQALDRFERSHKSSGSSNSSGSSSSSNSNGTGSVVSSVIDSATRGSQSSSASSQVALFFVCLLPPFTGFCVSSEDRVALEPYEGQSVPYVARRRRAVDRQHDEVLISDLEDDDSGESRRHLELAAAGYAALDDRIFAHDFAGRVYLGPLMLRGDWTRLYEPTASPASLSTLDLLKLRAGSNVLGPLTRTELYPTIGVLVMHGRDLTPALDAGLEARVYPSKPLVLYGDFSASFFQYGPVLFDTRIEPGIDVGIAEIRAGARWFYQYNAPSFIGPSASLALRF